MSVVRAASSSFHRSFVELLWGPGVYQLRASAGFSMYLEEKDLVFVFVVTSACCFLRHCANKYFMMLARSIGVKQQGKQARFAETLWYTFSYLLLFVLGIYSQVYEENWGINPDYFFGDYPLNEFKPFMRWFYLAYLSFYLQGAIFLMIEKRRKDFVVMVIHHAATIGLIIMSYTLKFFRIGAAVMILHDVADIFLYGTKTLYYADFYQSATYGFFVFAVTFFFSRLVLFPRLVYSTLFELRVVYTPPLTRQTAENSPHNMSVQDMAYTTRYYMSNIGLGTLQALHVFWFYLIIRMVARVAAEGNARNQHSDIRSDSDSDSEPKEKKGRKAKAAAAEGTNGHGATNGRSVGDMAGPKREGRASNGGGKPRKAE